MLDLNDVRSAPQPIITVPHAEEQGIKKLSAYFGGLISPSDTVIRSPIGKDLPDETLRTLVNELVRQHVQIPEYRHLLESELKERDYFGPQSPLPPWSEVRSRVQSEWNHQPHINPEARALTEAVDWLKSLVKTNSLRAWNAQRAVSEMDLSTNSGWPFFSRRSTVVEQSLKLAEMASRREDYAAVYIYGSRAKPTEDEPDRRTVYMAQFHLNILEKRVQMPLTNALRRTGFFASWEGPEKVDDALKDLQVLRKGYSLMSFDASGFDWHIDRSLIELVRDVVLSWFQPSDENLVLNAFDHVLYSYFITPDGVWEDSGHGIKSGWGLTNVVDSLLNLLAMAYMYNRLGLSLSLLGEGLPQVNGDDAVYRIEDGMLDDVESIYSEIGFEVSARKQNTSTEFVTFNSRVHIDGKEGIRPLWRFARGFFYPERANIVSDKAHSLIAIAKLHTIESHPAFIPCAKLIKGMDEFGLGTIGKHPLSSIVQGDTAQEVKEALKIDVKNEQRGAVTLRGLKSWKIVKLLQSGVI